MGEKRLGGEGSVDLVVQRNELECRGPLGGYRVKWAGKCARVVGGMGCKRGGLEAGNEVGVMGPTS